MRRILATAALACAAAGAIAPGAGAVLAQDTGDGTEPGGVVPGGAPGGSETGARPTAEAGFAAIQAAASSVDTPVLEKCLPAKLVAKWTVHAKDRAGPWRADFAGVLSRVVPTGVRESGDAAFARWTYGAPPATWELPLAFDGTRWNVDAPWAYVVAGGVLARANAKGLARVKLTARRENGPYGTSAFSFTHVTQDPAQCKNRMDVWYCHNGDLHFRGETKAAATEFADLSKPDGIPSDLVWKSTLAARAGTVYAVHCLRPDRMDFYATMRVTSCSAGAAEFEWRLLAAGPNAPVSIVKPQPLTTKDADDACDGLCGKSGK